MRPRQFSDQLLGDSPDWAIASQPRGQGGSKGSRGLQRSENVGVQLHRGAQRPRQRVISQGEISFQPGRSDVFQLSD
jgi:hypothetical protein